MKSATVIDCYERCKKIVPECLSAGKPPLECEHQAEKCRDVCPYK